MPLLVLAAGVPPALASSAPQPHLVAAGGTVAWGSKVDMAMHTGNVRRPADRTSDLRAAAPCRRWLSVPRSARGAQVGSWHRKQLAQVAKEHPDEVLVNEATAAHRTRDSSV